MIMIISDDDHDDDDDDDHDDDNDDNPFTALHLLNVLYIINDI